MSKNESILIFGFPGTGKTYAFEHQEELGLRLQDSDSSKFHWLMDDDGNYILDEDGKKVVHPAWPANYVQFIELTGREQEVKPDYIFVSTHEEVMKALLPLNFTSFLVVPDPSLKDRFMNLYKNRGSDEAFLDLMDKNWDKFIDSCTRCAIQDEHCACMTVLIREGGKVQNVSDLVKLKIAIPMEFDEEKE